MEHSRDINLWCESRFAYLHTHLHNFKFTCVWSSCYLGRDSFSRFFHNDVPFSPPKTSNTPLFVHLCTHVEMLLACAYTDFVRTSLPCPTTRLVQRPPPGQMRSSCCLLLLQKRRKNCGRHASGQFLFEFVGMTTIKLLNIPPKNGTMAMVMGNKMVIGHALGLAHKPHPMVTKNGSDQHKCARLWQTSEILL